MSRLSQSQIKEILQKYHTIAVVGLSTDDDKPSHRVAAYMKQNGYRIIPVNPSAEEILGEKSYKSLLDVPHETQKTIEIVDIFRRSADVPPIVDQAIKLKQANGKPFVVWMQSGIINTDSAEKAQKEGIITVMDRCIMVEHRKLETDQYSDL